MSKNSLSLKDSFNSVPSDNNPVMENDQFKQNIEPAFELFGTDKEKAKFCAIINKIATSETGKATLEGAAKAGYKLKMEFAMGSNGGTSKSKKLIVISPFESEDVSVSILTHEARHAVQFENGILDSEDLSRPRDYDIKSELMKYRATEADAQATAAQTVWEIMENGDMEPFRNFARVSPEIAKPFMDAAYEDENAFTNGKSRTAAFLGWYDNTKIKSAYENGYTVAVMEMHAQENIESKDTYDKTVSAAEVIKQTCFDENGQTYFTDDPEIIAQGKFVDISSSTKNFLKDYFKDFTEKTGNKKDNSFEDLPARCDDVFGMPTLSAPADKKLNIVNIALKNKLFQK